MWRRSAAAILAVALGLPGSQRVDAAPLSARVFRVGWLGHGNAAVVIRDVEEFQQGLRDVGYLEGRNLAVEYRNADGNVERLPGLAAELVRLPVDVIVTSGEPAALAARRTTRTIPIVVTEFGMDPVRAGLVGSLGRPDGNVTGLATSSEDLWQKRLGLLREIVPRLARLAVIWNPTNPGNANCIEEIRATAPAMGTQFHLLDVRDAITLDRALASIASEPLDALVTCWDSVTLAHAKRIGDFALNRQLPTLAPLKEYVQAGSLMSIGISLPAHRRRAAYYVDKILKGARPADLPVERTTNFELILNLTTAKAIGVALPPTLLLLADDIVR